MSRLRRFIELTVDKLFTFLVELADVWYQYQMDAITVLEDLHTSRGVTYSELRKSVRQAVFSLDGEDWQHTKREVAKDLQSRTEHIRVVFDMLIYMGLTEEQAETMLVILCSNTNIPDRTREELVTLYKECLILDPFVKTNKTAAPMKDAEKVYKTARKEKMIRFFVCIQACLPISVDTSSLEALLSKAVYHIDEEKINASLMQASGVKSETKTALLKENSTVELTSSETSTDNNERDRKEAKTKKEEKIPLVSV